MKQLSGLDASFLYMEQQHAPMHIGAFGIFDQSTVPGGTLRFKDIIARVVETAHLAPYTRQRLVEVPFNLDFPYWINDASFDPEFHIRHIALPAPGDWRQLCIQIARIYARPLDRKHPLWELYVIEGLDRIEGYPPGSFALLSKYHHACMDGRTATDVGMAISDFSPEMVAKPDPGLWVADAVPTPEELLIRAQINASVLKPQQMVELAKRSASVMKAAMEKLRSGDIKAPPEVPRTRFNTPISPHRVVEGIRFDLETVRAIKQSANATVNDAMLAICSGALRRYLLAKNELPDISLVTQCPISLRDPSATGDGGNLVSAMAVALRTDLADPARRLTAISEETRASKQYAQAVGAREMAESADFVNMGLATMGARIAAEQGLANYAQPAWNTVTTNVPGPQAPTYSFGARQMGGFGLGCITDGLGLFHMISSYNGTIAIGITACRAQMPDPDFYVACLQESHDELAQALVSKGAKVSRPSRRKAAVAKPVADGA